MHNQGPQQSYIGFRMLAPNAHFAGVAVTAANDATGLRPALAPSRTDAYERPGPPKVQGPVRYVVLVSRTLPCYWRAQR